MNHQCLVWFLVFEFVRRKTSIKLQSTQNPLLDWSSQCLLIRDSKHEMEKYSKFKTSDLFFFSAVAVVAGSSSKIRSNVLCSSQGHSVEKQWIESVPRCSDLNRNGAFFLRAAPNLRECERMCATISLTHALSTYLSISFNIIASWNVMTLRQTRMPQRSVVKSDIYDRLIQSVVEPKADYEHLIIFRS